MMADAETRILKRRLAVLYGVFAAILAAVALGGLWLYCALFGLPEGLRRENPTLSAQAAAECLEDGAAVRLGGDAYYTLPEGSGLGALLQPEAWASVHRFSMEEPDAVFHFGELCELCLWADGRAAFYDGYAGGNTRTCTYYSLPAQAVAALLEGVPPAASPGADPRDFFY